jgi:hypothetical protein
LFTQDGQRILEQVGAVFEIGDSPNVDADHQVPRRAGVDARRGFDVATGSSVDAFAAADAAPRSVQAGPRHQTHSPTDAVASASSA